MRTRESINQADRGDFQLDLELVRRQQECGGVVQWDLHPVTLQIYVATEAQRVMWKCVQYRCSNLGHWQR